MLVNIFAYGTLQIEKVMQAVTGQQFSSSPAILSGYRRSYIKQRVYPAIIQDPESITKGKLYFDIDEASLAALDAFEDVLYDRLQVKVSIEDDQIDAYAYVINPKYKKRLSDKAWSLQEFETKYLQTYLTNI